MQNSKTPVAVLLAAFLMAQPTLLHPAVADDYAHSHSDGDSNSETSLFQLPVPSSDSPSPTAPAPTIYIAPAAVIDGIKDEGFNHSQLMTSLTYLTEQIGPRLTGSPALRQANLWTRDILTSYGLKAALEPWGPFGRGWTLKKFGAQLDTPYALPLVAYPKAWSPSTPGEISGEVVYFDAKTEADFARFAGKLKGKIVLSGQVRELKPEFIAPAQRLTEAGLLDLLKAPDPSIRRPYVTPPTPPTASATAPLTGAAPGAAPAPAIAPAAPTTPATQQAALLKRLTFAANRLAFLKKEGVAVLMDNSYAGTGGVVFVAQATAPQDAPKSLEDVQIRPRLQPWERASEARMIPQMSLSSEHFDRLMRLCQMGVHPMMSVQITAKYNDDDPMVSNTIGEIPGTDLKDEIVMLGGHLDSWHGGTGATDNGCNIATVMEAMRILQKLNLKPRRTIRVALWTGEEQGLFGSAAYVKAHFGEMKAGIPGPGIPGPGTSDAPGTRPTLVKGSEYEKLSAYYNLDNGAGKIRGVFSQGNTGAAPIFSEWLKPFAALGAGTISPQNTGSTDHISFDRVGLPGFQFIQDDLDYFTLTHHSTQDVLERVPEEDVKFNAVVLAAFVYQTAMMDEKMPRKPLATRGAVRG